MVKHAIALGDRCASRAAMNGQAAVVSAIILGELEHVSAHRRLSGHVAEAKGGGGTGKAEEQPRALQKTNTQLATPTEYARPRNAIRRP
jgi:hypothetical protein